MRNAWLATASIALLAAFLSACGGRDRAPAAAGGAGALPGATAAGAVSGGTRLGDCEYATALVRSMERFTGAVPSFGAASGAGRSGVTQALNTFDTELAALVGELRGYRLAADVARINDGVVLVFEDARKQLPELRRAVESGDLARLNAVASTLTGDIFPRLDSIQSENKAAMDRLNKCATARHRSDTASDV